MTLHLHWLHTIYRTEYLNQNECMRSLCIQHEPAFNLHLITALFSFFKELLVRNLRTWLFSVVYSHQSQRSLQGASDKLRDCAPYRSLTTSGDELSRMQVGYIRGGSAH